MHESPRIRRLRNDLSALDRLRSESSIFQFKASGNPPHLYQITLKGKGLCREHGKIKIVHSHSIEIKLGASYPRTIPEIRWLTPVYHPNISEIGLVCLGGYGTHWVPSVQLDELCTMLWDMTRYHNYDIRSPYNRDAALWVANQTSILFPTDTRALRDLRVAQGRIEAAEPCNGSVKRSAPRDDQSRWGRLFRPRPTEPAPAKEESHSPAEFVREFIERYSRGFGENGGPGRVAVPDAQQPFDGVVQSEVPVAAAATSLLPAPIEEDPAMVALRNLGLPPEPRPEPSDDVIILEECADSPVEPSRAFPAGEDILFIE
jgi:ubiquitin-protein ligase